MVHGSPLNLYSIGVGSSGFLLLGIVALWAFGAVPHWVQRREQLAAAWRAEASDDELRLLERRELSRSSSAPASSAGRLLAAPRTAAAAPQTAAGPASTGKGSRPSFLFGRPLALWCRSLWHT